MSIRSLRTFGKHISNSSIRFNPYSQSKEHFHNMSSASEASASIDGDSPASSVFTDENGSQGSNTIITRSKSRRNASDLAQSECARRQSPTLAVSEPDIKIRLGVMFEDMTIMSAHRHVLLTAGNNFLEYCSTTDNNNSRVSLSCCFGTINICSRILMSNRLPR